MNLPAAASSVPPHRSPRRGEACGSPARRRLPTRLRLPFLLIGIVLNAVATGLYIGAGLGPGPRDGLMTGLARRGCSIRLARTSIELSVLTVGWLLGGTVGVGTLLYAVSIGPLVHLFLP